LDHHLVGDLYYRNRVEKVCKEADALKKKLIIAAGFLGGEAEFLEAKRKEFCKVKQT